jgi:hypothetical protein
VARKGVCSSKLMENQKAHGGRLSTLLSVPSRKPK